MGFKGRVLGESEGEFQKILELLLPVGQSLSFRQSQENPWAHGSWAEISPLLRPLHVTSREKEVAHEYPESPHHHGALW